ncbi:cytochrome P450 [Fusarium austroafricanum]|uniref:Cytochrome P450 n=1 Tax=Fusarium austroafricanum TaxID=2364996 RepID=A0A8H4KIS3_9HYPO|nr:cytochrome P450 [Fusarium austroafricanum]
MTSWLNRDQYLSQLQSDDIDAEKAAPCPSDYPQGQSYWIQDYSIDFEDECRAAALPAEVDVVVIGTGISAAACLYAIANQKPDLRVAVLEARGICSGATGRNGGHICRAEGTDLRALVEEAGEEEAIRLSHLGTRNRDLMLEAIDKLSAADDVDLRLTGTRVVFASEEERQTYLAELEYAKKLGISLEGHLVETEDLSKACNICPKKAQYGAASIDKSGTISPRKFVAALLRDAMKRITNLSIHPYNPVRSVQKSDALGSKPSYTVETDKGIIRCLAVVHATNAYASYLIPSLKGPQGVLGCKAECIAIAPNVSSAVDSTPPGLRGGLGFDEFCHYLIQRPNNGPFIYGWSGVEMVGNYDDSCTLPKGSDGIPAGGNVMKEFLESAFPESFEDIQWDQSVSHRWTGIQGFTQSGASLVGRHSKESPGEFISVGHNGEGMGRCFASSTVMTDRLLHYLDGKDESSWSAPEWFPRSFLYNI